MDRLTDFKLVKITPVLSTTSRSFCQIHFALSSESKMNVVRWP